MDRRTVADLSIKIMDELPDDLSQISSKPTIFKVHKRLREVNKKAYEPQIIAIGPYHRHNPANNKQVHLRAMEEQKKRYLKMLLQRRGEDNVERYVTAMRALEERARKCYAESVSLESDKFVEMMLVDGCFIIELLRKFRTENLRETNDPLWEVSYINNAVCRDLLLAENQLPLFVLRELFHLTQQQGEVHNFLEMISNFFRAVIGWYKPGQVATFDENSIENVEHLLGLLHQHCRPSPSETRNWEPIRCATELQEAGIKFKKVEEKSLFDIKFENGIMKIPRLEIDDYTESYCRNFIFHEQLIDQRLNYLTSYMTLMDCLINSSKDVELLCQCGIIENNLGNDEVAASMFNRLRDYVSFSHKNFYYSDLFNQVNEHCRRRRNKWMANLKHNYFNTPWALISFLAALSLLLFTLTQTVFSVLAYFE